MRAARLVAWIAAGAVAAAGAGVAIRGLDRAPCAETATAPLRVRIPAGSTLRAASDTLARRGVIGHPELFRLYAKIRGRDRAIKAGIYAFDCRRVSWARVLDRLALGPTERAITIPEGWSLKEIVPALARTVGAPLDSVLAAVRDTALRRELDVPTPDLEGYLFPDTYRFAYGTPPREAVAQMVKRFTSMWDPAWDAQLQRLAMSRHDIVTLASIVEKEAILAAERPVISAVYHNRLRDGMMLQADPTVQYARGAHTTRVLYKDLEIDSPYNTYRVKGLPPGPIASPGRASIEAALFPANVPYKFFVAHPDGHHEFRVTFEQHTEARREIRAQQRAPAAGRR